MKYMLIKIALHVMQSLIALLLISAIFWGGYLYIESDVGLLSDDDLVAVISDDVLGNKSYGKSCPRSSYEVSVNIELGGMKNSGYYTFNPLQGKEFECPAISVIASRRTGEAWIVDK